MGTSGYEVIGGASYKMDAKTGALSLLANFSAEIVREVQYIGGGSESQTILTVAGFRVGRKTAEDSDPDPVVLPEVDVSADDFGHFGWVMQKWGTTCVLAPGGVKDDLRAMIQLRSNPPVLTVYKEIGWHKVGKRQVYIHAGGGISAAGNDKSISTQLPVELTKYDLSSYDKSKAADSIRASVAMLGVCDSSITWPLFAATLAPLYGPVDFAIHLTGRTGSFKSELVSLFQSHYGPCLDARNLPCSWSSTANAMEALAFVAKNAVLVIDDFVPQGSSYQVKALQATADRIIRAQGNQAGRARLTDVSGMQTTMYPRGIVMSTGEDTPEGHSVRARMLIREISAGDIQPADLTVCQGMRPLYCGTIAWLAESLAREPADLKARADAMRSELQGNGHSRTPGMLARLIVTIEDFFMRIEQAKLATKQECDNWTNAGIGAIQAAGQEQASYLEDSDPVDMFFAGLRQIFASGGGHARSLNGGIPKSNFGQFGWSVENSEYSMPTYKSRGTCIGWIDAPKGAFYFDVTAGFPQLKKTLGAEMQLSKNTLFKRLKDAGALTRVDDSRSRNTVRITAEGNPHLVLSLQLARVLSPDGSDPNAADKSAKQDPAGDEAAALEGDESGED